MSRRETVLAGYAARLAAAAATWSPAAAFERNRLEEVQPSEMPRLVMFDGGQTVIDAHAAQTDYAIEFEIEAYVTAATGAALGAAVSTMHADIVIALWGADFTLAGVVQRLGEEEFTDPAISHSEDAGYYAAFAILFSARFSTAEGDPRSVP